MFRMASKYDPIKPEIIRLISEGETLGAACRALGIPSYNTIYEWLDPKHSGHDPAFAEDYARARLHGYHSRADELRDIVRDKTQFPDPAERRLVFDHARWELSKMLPKIYGDKLDVTSGGEKLGSDLSRLSIEELDALKAIRAKIDGSGD